MSRNKLQSEMAKQLQILSMFFWEFFSLANFHQSDDLVCFPIKQNNHQCSIMLVNRLLKAQLSDGLSWGPHGYGTITSSLRSI